MRYAEAFERQRAAHAAVLAAREAGAAEPGELLMVEHEPVVTVSKRATAADNVLATPALLARHGVELAETDRGGDVTYHGPGQVVAYPIVDLNVLGLNLHAYMRLLEEAAIATLARWGLTGLRDPEATGVWLPGADGRPERKIAAMGVRVRRWIAMHGLSLNVSPEMAHFGLIVPCGLVGRPVTSMRLELGTATPPVAEVSAAVAEELQRLCAEAMARRGG
jgi:lipoyl(octanoyl) transferase